MQLYRTALRILLVFSFLLSTSPAFSDGDFGLPTAEPESLGMSSKKLDEIKTQLQPLIDEKKVPGFITVVARQGKVVHFEAFGSMDVERKKAMQADTIFRMYSMTKPVTGAAVMILVQEGKINLKDPVSKYIPEFADMKVLVQTEKGATSTIPAHRPIIIEHLLTHTSGLTYNFFGNAVSKIYAANGVDSDGGSGLTLEEFVKKVAEQPLLAQPGTQWNYSISMDVLGRVVEVVSGQRYGDFLQARIFAPLGMKDSGFQVPADRASRFAANYAPDRESPGMVLADDPGNSRYLKVPSQDSGGGGMVGTAADYLRFAQMLLNGGELDGVRILGEESVRDITSDHLGEEFGGAPLSTMLPFGAEGIGFGYCGAVIKPGAGNTVFGGPGQYTWGGAASTDFWIDKRQKLVGMVLTQLMPAGAYPTRMIMNTATYEAVVEKYN
ncbi:MAG: serine hydrolase domain-containing protein [Gammaproteobacteria bacterium]|jgi:CubicO group peptidase (beta-lactamase class C family)|nr:serine hydrolase domain-containing protein [Gammaproteobacteria bacterium]|tara:strand:+ start:368 stop:1684 length:1317 start_codon:yes stop_codon:yes gene_type:complete